jgi:hypothetical protein
MYVYRFYCSHFRMSELSNGNGRHFLNEYKGVPNNIIAGQDNFSITDICIKICCFVDIRRLVKFSL